jgi:hypothetical protein
MKRKHEEVEEGRRKRKGTIRQKEKTEEKVMEKRKLNENRGGRKLWKKRKIKRKGRGKNVKIKIKLRKVARKKKKVKEEEYEADEKIKNSVLFLRSPCI